MNRFSLTIPFLIHLIDTTIPHTWSFTACLSIYVKFYPSQLKPLFNTILIMFFIGFPIFSYLNRPDATTSTGYTKTCTKPIKCIIKLCTDHNILWVKHATHKKTRVFKDHFSFKIRQYGQQKLSLQYKVYWILYEMVDTPLLSQTYLCMQPPLWSPPKIRFSTLVNSTSQFHP